MFLPSQILWVWVPQKFYQNSHTCTMASHVENFPEIFIVRKLLGDPCPRCYVHFKPWSFCSTCKNLMGQNPLRAKIWSSKVDFGWVEMRYLDIVVSGQTFTIFC